MMKYKFWNLILFSFIAVSCTKQCTGGRKSMTPQEVVEAYLQIAFNMSEITQKDMLLQYTAGELHTAIAGASDDTIVQAYVASRYKLQGYSWLETRDRTPRETEITYSLSYYENPESSKGEDAALITTTNTVSLIRENGAWFIRQVLKNKTSIEFPLYPENKIEEQR